MERPPVAETRDGSHMGWLSAKVLVCINMYERDMEKEKEDAEMKRCIYMKGNNVIKYLVSTLALSVTTYHYPVFKVLCNFMCWLINAMGVVTVLGNWEIVDGLP